MATHYCGGMAVESQWMLIKKDLDCGMSDKAQECEKEMPYGQHFSSEPCCQNEFRTFGVDSTFKIPVPEAVPHWIFAAVLIHSFILPSFHSSPNSAHYAYHPPPLPDGDIQILHQTFLI